MADIAIQDAGYPLVRAAAKVAPGHVLLAQGDYPEGHKLLARGRRLAQGARLFNLGRVAGAS